MEISLGQQHNHPYFNKSAVITTKHKKYSLIEPAFTKYLELNLLIHEADTDQLGTFSGEIERKFPPRETAILKAKIGMEKLGLTLGIASEGSVGPDPLMPFINSDIEHLVLVDSENDLVISEVYRSFEISAAQIVSKPGEVITNFLEKVDFPNHKLIVSTNSAASNRVIKGVANSTSLNEAVKICANESEDGLALIQSDLRAHCSPSRQSNIRRVAELLAARVQTLCPLCRLPGWGKIGFKKGLECALCGDNVGNAISCEIFGCVKCDYQEFGDILSEYADPAQCDYCNP